MALSLGAAGASIALASRDVEQLNEVKEEVESVGGNAQVFQADVSDEEQIRKLEHDVIGSLQERPHPGQQRGHQSSEAVGRIHTGRVAPRYRYQPDQRLSSVPFVCAPHERQSLWTGY